MKPDPADNPEAVAVEQLEQLGLSTYAARTFVALSSLGIGTARSVSEVSDVPRTRVYDAIDELHDRGLVDVQNASPRKFWASSPETASRMFEHDVEHRTEVLRSALADLEPSNPPSEQRGVWTVDGQAAVTNRVVEFVEQASEQVVYMTIDDLLTADVLDALAAASERGVDIKLAGSSTEVMADIQERIPGATVFESMWVWSDTPAGRLLLVDGTKTLVSALVNGPDALRTDPRSETAIWGEGERNSLVVVLKAMFTWRLEELGDDPT